MIFNILKKTPWFEIYLPLYFPIFESSNIGVRFCLLLGVSWTTKRWCFRATNPTKKLRSLAPIVGKDEMGKHSIFLTFLLKPGFWAQATGHIHLNHVINESAWSLNFVQVIVIWGLLTKCGADVETNREGNRERTGRRFALRPRSNERNLRKTRKILQRKGCHFYCSKFDTLPVSCWFTNFTMKVLSIWKWVNSELLTPFVKANVVRVRSVSK